jgi:hypothetical protein
MTALANDFSNAALLAAVLGCPQILGEGVRAAKDLKLLT